MATFVKLAYFLFKHPVTVATGGNYFGVHYGVKVVNMNHEAKPEGTTKVYRRSQLVKAERKD